MAHCSIYVKMEKGLQPGKFSLTAVLLTFSDLSHSRQTKTLSSGCSFSRKMQNVFASFAKTYFKNRKRTF